MKKDIQKSSPRPLLPIATHSAVFLIGAVVVFIALNGRNQSTSDLDGAANHQSGDRHRSSNYSSGDESRPSSKSSRTTSAPNAPKNSAAIIARLGEIRLIGDPLDRQTAWLNLIKQLGPNDFEAAAEEFRKLEHYVNAGSDFDLLMRGWAKIDPIAALSYANDKLGSSDNAALVLSTWAGYDPDAAERWALSNHQGDGANRFLAAVISGIAPSDVQRATRMAATLPDGRERERAAEYIARALLVQGADAAMVFPSTVQDPKLRASLVSNLSQRLARRDPEAAASWLEKMNDPDAQRRSARGVAERLARNDMQSATSWISRLSPEAQAEAALGVVVPMSSNDIPGTARWLSSLSGIPNYDSVVEEFVWSCDVRAPEQSAAWIQGVSDPDRQIRLYHRMLGEWSRRDANAVKQWVSTNQVPESVTRRFMR